MTFRLLLLLSQLLLLSLGGKPCKGAPDVQCSKNAQTAAAYQGYCKGCFAIVFPQEYEQIKGLRKKSCIVCGAHRELERSLCRPCLHSRTCSDCHGLNLALDASRCGNCEGFRKSLGAVQSRLALWCLSCSTADERKHGLCRPCLTVSSTTCDHCASNATGTTSKHKCSASDCSVSFSLCRKCCMVFSSSDQLLCNHCWREKGMICVSCGFKARHNTDCYRRCLVRTTFSVVHVLRHLLQALPYANAPYAHM